MKDNIKRGQDLAMQTQLRTCVHACMQTSTIMTFRGRKATSGVTTTYDMTTDEIFCMRGRAWFEATTQSFV